MPTLDPRDSPTSSGETVQETVQHAMLGREQSVSSSFKSGSLPHGMPQVTAVPASEEL